MTQENYSSLQPMFEGRERQNIQENQRKKKKKKASKPAFPLNYSKELISGPTRVDSSLDNYYLRAKLPVVVSLYRKGCLMVSANGG